MVGLCTKNSFIYRRKKSPKYREKQNSKEKINWKPLKTPQFTADIPNRRPPSHTQPIQAAVQLHYILYIGLHPIRSRSR